LVKRYLLKSVQFYHKHIPAVIYGTVDMPLLIHHKSPH